MHLGTSVKQAYCRANWSSLFACCSVSACRSAADPLFTSVPTVCINDNSNNLQVFQPVCIGDSEAVIICKCLPVLLCRQMRGPLHTLPLRQLGNAFPWQQCKYACFQMPAGWTWHVLVQIIGKSMIMQQFLQSLIHTTHLTSKLRAQMGRSYMRVA